MPADIQSKYLNIATKAFCLPDDWNQISLTLQPIPLSRSFYVRCEGQNIFVILNI